MNGRWLNMFAEIDRLMAEVRALGIEIADGMPVPEDEPHAMMALSMLRKLVSAHKAGKHTPFCKCGLRSPGLRAVAE